LPWLRGVCPHKHCPLCQHNQYLIELEHRVGHHPADYMYYVM